MQSVCVCVCVCVCVFVCVCVCVLFVCLLTVCVLLRQRERARGIFETVFVGERLLALKVTAPRAMLTTRLAYGL